MVDVCLKIGYIPNEIVIFHRIMISKTIGYNGGTQHFQTNPYSFTMIHHCFGDFGESMLIQPAATPNGLAPGVTGGAMMPWLAWHVARGTWHMGVSENG